MMNQKIRIILTAILTLSLLVGLALQVSSINLGDILKVGTIAYVVDRFAPEINTFVNTLLKNEGVSITEATKVVPIISLGDGSYVGAAQVSGAQANVDKVKAAVEIQGERRLIGARIYSRVLVPASSFDVKNIQRVKGVGVSAVIAVKI